jgi:glycosyltransferase involved in cell wall biosynthesis
LNPCLLIPVYDHGRELEDVVARLEPLGLPCIVVDDGSHDETRLVIDGLAERLAWVTVKRRLRNGGKGAALKSGYATAASTGYTHALQLDADGQHDVEDVRALWQAAKTRPEALVLGRPEFDETAPAARRHGRLVSLFWVHVETLSRRIGDPLCGLRCMPLEATQAVLARRRCGDHMEFDPEIAVRLVWAGVPVVNVPCRVRYPDGGTSHFDLFRDNVRISWMHTRLFFEMIGRLPWLLASRRREADERSR